MNFQDPQTYAIIGAAFQVHKALGNGFLEVVYQEALEKEFIYQNIPFEREKSLSIYYRGELLNTSYRADFICFARVIVELKAISRLSNTEESQVINYLNASNLDKGLLLNFGSRSLEHKRFINNHPKP